MRAGQRILDALKEATQTSDLSRVEAIAGARPRGAADELPPVPESFDASQEYDFAIRRVPVRTAATPLSIPPDVAGRSVARTLGPFLDAAGLPVWIDLFLRVRETSVVRAPGSEPFLIVPLRRFVLSGAADYTLPVGSIWILARLLVPSAPAGGYCGIRIKGGRLRLSSPATVAGGTLQIGPGVIATLDIDTDPASAPASATLGRDGGESRSDAPPHARFVFRPAGGVLDAADDSKLTAYGATVALRYRAGLPGRIEPLLGRAWLPLDVAEGNQFRIRRSRSELFHPSGESAAAEGGWALAVTVPASPASLGPAEGAGGVAVRLASGIRADWRGMSGSPVRFDRTVVMTEPGRLTVATARESGANVFQTIQLWHATHDGQTVLSQATLGFSSPEPLRYFSEAGTGDSLLIEASVDATLDRPVGAIGARFPLRGIAAALLSQTAAGFEMILLADVAPPPTGPPYRGPLSLALANALLRLGPPTALLIRGAWDTPDRVRAGIAAVLFGVRTIVPALRDPYVTNYVLPFSRDVPGVAGVAPFGASADGGALLAVIGWLAPDRPDLQFFITPRSGSYTGLLDVLPEPAARVATPAAVAVNTQAEDAAADAALRAIFERTATSTRERLLLVDVSSNIDQFGIGFGLGGRDATGAAPAPGGPASPLQISAMYLSAPGRNLRLVLLPQFQWEPVSNQFNPLVGPFPDPLASADDGGPTVIGTPSVTLVPIAPERLASTMLHEFNEGPHTPLAAKFTLPFGMKAAARFQPEDGTTPQWASLDFNRPGTADGRLTGGIQIRARSLPERGVAFESPSFPGAAWQTRNGINPTTLLPYGMSVLAATFGNPGVEQFFNNEMAPSGFSPRVPVRRVEFSGYGASAFSNWGNPNAVAEISQVRFDVFVGRTAYEVVQVASILYPWAVPVVRTITLERRKEGFVFRFDSGWVATGPGLYRYPPPDLAHVTPPVEWTPIETHPGVVRGAWNVRRIRETNRVVTRDFGPIHVELLEVRFDADFDIENVIKGAGANGLVPSREQVGYVQRTPVGYPLIPAHLAAILDAEGPPGGAIDCLVDITRSGQLQQVARVDVAPVDAGFGAPPQFAAAARGTLALPKDGDWSAVRHDLSTPEPQPTNAQTGVPLVRAGTASGSIPASPSYRIAEPVDVLREPTPAIEFGLLQGSDGHRVLFPRPRILAGSTEWSSTEKPVLADTYTLSLGVGLFPPQNDCFVGDTAWGLSIDAGTGRYTLLPATTMRFTAPPPVADRRIVDTAPFKIRTRYESDMKFTLDPAQPQPWKILGDSIFTTMDLGPFSELVGVRHGFLVGAGQAPAFISAKTIYPPPLQPVVDVLEFLASLFGVDNALGIEGSQGSFNFKASLTINIVNPRDPDGFIDFGGFELKGKLALGVASSPRWNGFLKIALGTRVPVLPPIFGGGEVSVELDGSALGTQEVTIEVKWSASVGKRLGPVAVKATWSFGIQVVTSNTGSWQIGLLVGIAGTADVWIVKITIRIELLAAIKILSAAEAPPSGAKRAIGQAKVAADVTIAVFVTITVEFTIQVQEDLHF
jgi:hypothetical protein